MKTKRKPPEPKRLTHKERADRRKRIALEIKAGANLRTVAQREQMSEDSVRNACKLYGVPLRGTYRFENPTPLRVLAFLFDTSYSIKEIALKLGMVPNTVASFARQARDLGIPVPKRSK